MINDITLSWICVADIRKAKKFFVDTLGLDIIGEDDEWGWLELQGTDGGMVLGVGKDHKDPDTPIRKGQNAIICFNVDDIEKSIKKLKSKGVEFIGDIIDIQNQIKMIFFRDEDGNMFQLVETIA